MENSLSKLALALVLLAFVPIISATVSDFTTCGRRSKGFGTADVHDVRIIPCEDGKRCVLKKGTNVTVEIDFTPSISSSAPVTAAAHWALSSRSQLPLPRMDTNACKTTTCPLAEGNRQTYTYHLFVSSGYPPRNYNVKWTLTARPFVMCIFFPIKIVN